MLSRRTSVVFLLVVLLSGSSLLGQAVGARLDGTVEDVTGAVIPGVTVTLTNPATNLTLEALSNERGLYVFVNVRPGLYTLGAELPGFKRHSQPNLRLEVGQTLTMDIVLQTGELTEEVTVISSSVKVDTVSQSVGAVVTNDQVVQLPLQNRDPMNLIYMQAGVLRANEGFLGGRVDGLRGRANNVTIEGISSADPMLTGGASNSTAPIIPEAMEEYKIVSSSAAAEDGQTGGAQVKLIYKSGTNEFHGSVWEFHRNRALNANSFFLNKSGIDKPAFRRHQYGFAVGGPIVRDKAFFHFTYENQTQVEDTTSNFTVYTTRFANSGIFQYVDTNDGQTKEIDLTTVDPTRPGMDSSFSTFANSLPPPNNNDLGDGLNTAGFRYSSDDPFDEWRLIAKGDYIFNDDHRLGLSFAWERQDDPSRFHIDGFRAFTNVERYPAGIITLTSSFSPTFLNELRLGGTSRLWKFGNGNPNRETTIPIFTFTGLGGGSFGSRGGSANISNFLPQQGPSVTYTINDNVSWIRGNHTFKGGVDIRINQSNVGFGGDHYLPVASTSTSFNPASIPAIDGLGSSDAQRAQQLANDVTGSLGVILWTFQQITPDGTAFVPFETKFRRWRSKEYSFFFQDTWKVRPNLTLQAGLRWEVLPSHYEDNGIFSYPVDASGNGCSACLFGISGPGTTVLGLLPEAGRDLYDTDWNNFAPNLGFTWDPGGDGKWSIAANYRISYDHNALVTTLFQDFSQEGASSTRLAFGQPGDRLGDSQIRMAEVDPGVPFGPKPFNRQGTVTVWDGGYTTPYVQSWSLRFQRELMRDTVVEVAYVGNHGTGLARALDINELEVRSNGFLDGFKAAAANFAASGDPMVGADTGVFGAIWQQLTASQQSGQLGNLSRGEVASMADFIDQSLGGAPLAAAGLPDNFFRANPQFDAAWLMGRHSHSTYNGLKMEVRRRFSDGLQFQVNYTWSKGLTDYEGGQSQRNSFRDNLNRKLDKSRNSIDARHVINANGIWEVPIGRGRRWGSDMHGILDHILGGWQLNGILAYNTATPITVQSSGRNNLTTGDSSTAGFSGTDHKFTSKAVSVGNQIRNITEEEEALFSQPVAGSAGFLAPRFFDGQPFWVLDGSVFKSFRTPWFAGEDSQLQFRFEFFNLTNSTRFNNGTSNLNSGSFGVLSSARDARIMQVALKFLF